jgi:hypothetical protein
MAARLERPAVVAFFYCLREQAPFLEAHLLAQLPTLERQDDGLFLEPTTYDLLWRFFPESDPDAAVIQIVFNPGGAAQDGWRVARARLEALTTDNSFQEKLWGYTLIYQAVGEEPYDGFYDLLPITRKLGAAEEDAPKDALVQTSLRRDGQWLGEMWLVDYPPKGKNGWDAATVSVVLNTSETNDELMSWLIFGPDAVMVPSDLAAHKGYYLLRQYRMEGWVGRYKMVLNRLYEATDSYLSDSFELVPGEREDVSDDDDVEIRTFEEEYPRLLRVVPALKRLRSSLSPQLQKFERAVPREGIENIVAYHHSQLQKGYGSLEEGLRSGEESLTIATQVLELIRARQEQKRARQEQKITLVLTVVGATVGLPELLPAETICALFGWQCQEWGFPMALAPVFVQVGIIILLSTSGWVAVKWWLQKK